MNLSRCSKKEVIDGLLYCSFNQDTSFFSVGTEYGYRIHSCTSLTEKARQEIITIVGHHINNGSHGTHNHTGTGVGTSGGLVDSNGNGLGIVEMLYRTNLIALVGGGKSPKYPNNRVIIYDHAKSQVVFEIEFKSEVKSIKMRRERLVIVLKSKVIVYQLSAQPAKLYTFETCDNEKGLAALSTATNNTNSAVLAIPGRTPGQIQIIDMPLTPISVTDLNASTTTGSAAAAASNSSTTPSFINQTAVSLIAAHESALACLAISSTGQYIASASEKGTLIRIFDAYSTKKVQELRRGVDPAEIYSIQFNQFNNRLCIASDKGTIHIFNFKSEDPDTAAAAANAQANPQTTTANPSGGTTSLTSSITTGNSNLSGTNAASSGNTVSSGNNNNNLNSANSSSTAAGNAIASNILNAGNNSSKPGTAGGKGATPSATSVAASNASISSTDSSSKRPPTASNNNNNNSNSKKTPSSGPNAMKNNLNSSSSGQSNSNSSTTSNSSQQQTGQTPATTTTITSTNPVVSPPSTAVSQSEPHQTLQNGAITDYTNHNNNNKDNVPPNNRQSSLTFLAPFLPKYFSSEWSFAHAKLPVEVRCICGFVTETVVESNTSLNSSSTTTTITDNNNNNANTTNNNNNSAAAHADTNDVSNPSSLNGTFANTTATRTKELVMVLCSDGSVYRYSFDQEKGGECVRENYQLFYKGLTNQE